MDGRVVFIFFLFSCDVVRARVEKVFVRPNISFVRWEVYNRSDEFLMSLQPVLDFKGC